MTDLDLLTGAIAARLRLLPQVARLYPARTDLPGVGHTVEGLLDAVADDPTVTIRLVDDAHLIETTVGIADNISARQATTAIYAAVRDTCIQQGIVIHHVRVRIATIG